MNRLSNFVCIVCHVCFWYQKSCNWYHKLVPNSGTVLVPVIWYQNLVPVSGTYVMGITQVVKYNGRKMVVVVQTNGHGSPGSMCNCAGFTYWNFHCMSDKQTVEQEDMRTTVLSKKYKLVRCTTFFTMHNLTRLNCLTSLQYSLIIGRYSYLAIDIVLCKSNRSLLSLCFTLSLVSTPVISSSTSLPTFPTHLFHHPSLLPLLIHPLLIHNSLFSLPA